LLDRGWRFLQNDDLKNASTQFATILKNAPHFYPALTAAAYVRLADSDYRQALAQFDSALHEAPTYVPALVGRGHTLLAMKRDAEAAEAFEAALAVDGSLTEIRQRVEVLRFRALQEVISRARSSARAGHLEDARDTFEQALKASPDSALLHRELGAVEKRRGDATAAIQHMRRATELDPTDPEAFAELGGLLEAQKDYVGAESAYRKAVELDPTGGAAPRLAAVTELARLARLPEEYRSLGELPQMTRGDLAALIGIRLEDVVVSVSQRQVVMTDIRNHWASPWIARVAEAGVLEPFANHTFQPRTRIRRVDLAIAVSRLLTIVGVSRPDLRVRWSKARPRIADVPSGHLSYSAVALAVASGVMPLLDGARFQMSRPVSGAEAIETIDRVRALAAAK
jgi:tetratricopeptide (TPR) repeat protein